MKTVIEQQIELTLGDKYAECEFRGRKFVASLLSSPGLRIVSQRILNNEGGFENLLNQALIKIIEKGDIDSGLSAFGTYLQEEYNLTNNRTSTHHTKWVSFGDNYSSTVEGVGSPSEVSFGEPSAGLHPKRPHVDEVIKTDEERELWQLLGDFGFGGPTNQSGRQPTYGRLAEAIRILGWDRKRGMLVYHRVKQRYAALNQKLLEE